MAGRRLRLDPEGGSVAVLGAGPIGDMAARIARRDGARVLSVDLVNERLQRAHRNGMETFGTSLSGVYGGQADPLPLLTLRL